MSNPLNTLHLAEAIAALKASDTKFAALIEQVGSCSLYQTPESGDLLFCLSRTIIHQQLSTRVAKTIHGRFLALFSNEVPTAEAILALSVEQLRAVGLSRPKITYLVDLAQWLQAELPALADLETQPDQAIIETLTQVKGIGRWSVQMLLLFRLGRQDVWPAEDLGIQTALQRLYDLEQRPKAKATAALGEPWRPYRSIAAWYLWRSLE